MEPLLNLENVTRTYQKGENTVYALNSFTEQINKSEFVSIVGRLGSDKSTVLNHKESNKRLVSIL
jgi:putative ABC transport system ATP-binding protein